MPFPRYMCFFFIFHFFPLTLWPAGGDKFPVLYTIFFLLEGGSKNGFVWNAGGNKMNFITR